MAVSRDLGLKELIRFNLYLFGLLALHRNDYAYATKYFSEYFDRAVGEKLILCIFLTGMSAVAGGTSQPERCAKLYGAAQALIEGASDFRMNPFDRAEFDRHIQIARDQIGNARFNELSKEGGMMTMEQAIEWAVKTKVD